MKANELRIGNWFIEYDEPQQFNGDFYHLIDIKPIPLTREWVIKLGFKCVWGGSGEDLVFRYGEYCKTMDLIQRSVFKYCLPVGSCELKIEYVHQLQNLYFALTGDELTIQC
jgi:hypothetical protein